MAFTRHRRFLCKTHPYRRQKKAFDGKKEFDFAPKPLSGHDVLKTVEGINCCWGKKSGKLNAKRKISESCWKKKSIFFELEYWKHFHVRHVLDVMHIEKNVCESIIGTLLDIPGKTKDGVAARLDLVEMNVRMELAPKQGEKRTFLPPACYTLRKKEKKKVCNSLLHMKVPTGYSSNVRNLVNVKELKLVGLKSYDCHTFMQQLLPVAIRGVLPKHVRSAITRLCFFFNVICSKVIDASKLDALQDEIVTMLCLLEKYFPPSFFDIMVHLTVHLVREVKLCGPVWCRWMYPFERYMKILKGYVRNRNRPEGCIAECYISEEAIEFCSEYLSNVQTIGIPSIFHEVVRTRPLSGAQVQSISQAEWEQSHRYILANDVEIDQYAKEHMAHLKATLRGKVGRAINDSTHEISERLKWLAHGPRNQVLKYSGYLIEGVTFHTKDRDNLRAVQNSGVSLVGNIMQVSSAKDKNLVESDMVFYGVIDEIWELDYHTFRVPVFKCNWVENNNGIKVDDLGFKLVNLNRIGFKSDSFILGS
ncbi:PREDICTED: uncharacterized protein LOC109168279 [Ipomoea nil]|uniref:uncharacterized protein LOC109168279 n=1 Tax=Ipomoea nil TaxID=35883 RepID=UPI000901F274|nr:PREDICTED: uncharacterized protein LOC109168279 [Ipomoea nil]